MKKATFFIKKQVLDRLSFLTIIHPIQTKIGQRILFLFIFKIWSTFASGTFKVKAGLAQMAKGGIIMDVTTPEEARIAEEAGVSWS